MPIDTISNASDSQIANDTSTSSTTVTQNTSVINSNGDCLSTSNFCMNSGKCGLNGNCICARFFYGKQCELSIAPAQRVTFMSEGLGNERVFLICAMFIIVLPFLAYLLFSFLVKMCDPQQESFVQCLSDTFFCFPCFFKIC